MQEGAIPEDYVGVWRGGRDPRKRKPEHWWDRFFPKRKDKTEDQLLEEGARRIARQEESRRKSRVK